MNKANIRLAHELANNSYSVLAYWCANLATTALLLVFCLPGVAIGYFMMGFPARAFPVMMLNAWMVRRFLVCSARRKLTVFLCFFQAGFVGDAMLNVVTKFSKDTSTDVVVSQLVLVLLTLFGGGVFIRFDETPGYWEWLQALSLFTHSSRMAMINIMSKLTYTCKLAPDNNCYGAMYEMYKCVPSTSTGSHCDVTGEEVLYVTQGIGNDESYWNSFGYLVVLFVGFELTVLLFMYFPVERIIFTLQQQIHSPTLMKEIISSHLEIRALKGKVMVLIQQRLKHLNADADVDEKSHGNFRVLPQDDIDYSDPEQVVPHRSSDTCTLSWKNLNLVLKNKDTKLIDNASGYVDSGRVLALMGPSGAGKTTLLNALAGRAPYANVTGDVMFAGRPLLPSDLMYVPQFDEIKGYTTVLEQIQFVGMMKCSDVVGMQERLYKLLQILGLFSRAGVLCKNLSGGELKRVSVGMGMISNPNVLFLDGTGTFHLSLK
jgi:ABC-type lipoprotein export system ATPase subunit